MFDSNNSGVGEVKLIFLFVVIVMILDDDYLGIFYFEEKEMNVSEVIGEVEIKVVRLSGVRGTVRVFYYIIDGSVKKGRDFDIIDIEVIFYNDEIE